MKSMSESYKIMRMMKAGEISPLEGWRALRVAYAAMSPADRVQDYICAACDMGYVDEVSPCQGLYRSEGGKR